MPDGKQLVQWHLSVWITHEPGFKHVIRAAVQHRGARPIECGRWSWSGIGVPAPVELDVVTRVGAILSEHLATRYGVQGTFPTSSEGVVDPF